MGLEEGEVGGEHEGYVVHARGESGSVWALAAPAGRIEFCLVVSFQICLRPSSLRSKGAYFHLHFGN